MIHVRGRGLRSLSDLILGLPGETYRSHVDSIHTLLDAGTHEMHNFQSMMLKGSEMEMVRSREKYQFDSRFRVLPKNFGEYDGERVFDMDEIVVGTDSLTFDEYIRCRQYHLGCSLFTNNSWFDDVLGFAKTFGVKPSEWIDAIVVAMQADEGPMGRLMHEFTDETKNELFPTHEACRDFYGTDENFARLVEGRIGDNLMYKYRAKASFFEWPAVCALAMNATRALLVARGANLEIPDFDALWNDFASYTLLRHAHGASSDEILTPATATFRYDIRAWIEAGMPHDPSTFKLPSAGNTVVFRLTPDGDRELRAALQVWTTSLKGLTKGVTRIRNSAQMRIAEREGQGQLPTIGSSHDHGSEVTTVQ
jgi:hypothetical protein